MRKISIIGFGRFGKTLYQLFKDDFSITIFDKDRKAYKDVKLNKNAKIAKSVKEIYESNTIFFAVPISTFEKVISSHKKYFKDHLLIDVLSVKLHPAKIFKKYLKNTKTQSLLTHPMFGPDSSKNGFKNLPIVLDKFMTDSKNYSFWKNYFKKKGLKIAEMSAKKHDKLAANSQGVTHFVGRLLEGLNFQETKIDTLGAKKLHEIKDQTCNDTWELFLNLQNYNPYTKNMRIRLGKVYNRLYNQLLPKQINSNHITYGIQGGVGSFNEEAILTYAKKNKIKDFKIKYLYTTEKVLKNLKEGNIDYGIFAIENSVGGLVQESIYGMAKYRIKIRKEFAIIIRHFLMKRKDVDIKKIDTIMAHPQALKQCQATLKRKYPKMKLASGKGNLIDTAKLAEALSKGKLSKDIAILGPKVLSRLYDLEIIDEDLQDNKENYTSFLLVER
ncbi:hypothetical protein COY23_01840 [bacterium (Candidatus Torokbacteria) CG_4_10_14_0_2_um_filter_35_8]|nr:MAG: hypothetical protein COY23_01840 [bacterium (Candidatus Torokbacteria) CG_4_10_14_0_2_um_filter_35_8]